eukprot:TRINITY_DN1731_c1_g1_i1.p1 TRINITY_DN1731_c1_g1~~TRINITY_DN1731_c1_g1_i1.p1  ORF type:complete len:650 (+),score=45.81 TRINITY_DN1731_c1_g1_i1:182-1951(+)
MSSSTDGAASEAARDDAAPSAFVYRCQACHEATKRLTTAAMDTESFCPRCADDTEWIREEFQDESSVTFTADSGNFTPDSNVRLLVGGRVFSTTVQTILDAEPDCVFAPIFSNTFALGTSDGCITVDRPCKWFATILDYCRQGSLVGCYEFSDLDEIEQEADYYGMQNLLNHIACQRYLLGQKRKQEDRARRRLRRLQLSMISESIMESENVLLKQGCVLQQLESQNGQRWRLPTAAPDSAAEHALKEELLERDIQVCQVMSESLTQALRNLQGTFSSLRSASSHARRMANSPTASPPVHRTDSASATSALQPSDDRRPCRSGFVDTLDVPVPVAPPVVEDADIDALQDTLDVELGLEGVSSDAASSARRQESRFIPTYVAPCQLPAARHAPLPCAPAAVGGNGLDVGCGAAPPTADQCPPLAARGSELPVSAFHQPERAAARSDCGGGRHAEPSGNSGWLPSDVGESVVTTHPTPVHPSRGEDGVATVGRSDSRGRCAGAQNEGDGRSASPSAEALDPPPAAEPIAELPSFRTAPGAAAQNCACPEATPASTDVNTAARDLCNVLATAATCVPLTALVTAWFMRRSRA